MSDQVTPPVAGHDAAVNETLSERPTHLYTQLNTLEQACLADWRDKATGDLPEGWWPDSIVISFGDALSSCYTVEFSGHRDWDTHTYTVSLSGFQWADEGMSDLPGTTVSVFDKASAEVTYADENLEPTPDRDEQILNIYSDVLHALLDPKQDGVRIEVRFAKVRKVTESNPMTRATKQESDAITETPGALEKPIQDQS